MPFTALSRSSAVTASAQHGIELWMCANAMARATLEGVSAFYDPRRLRRLWLAELSRAADDYMRSEAFLELMHRQLGVMSHSMRIMFPLRRE